MQIQACRLFGIVQVAFLHTCSKLLFLCVGKDNALQLWCHFRDEPVLVPLPAQTLSECSTAGGAPFSCLQWALTWTNLSKSHQRVQWMSSAFHSTYINHPNIILNATLYFSKSFKILSWLLSVELDVNQAVDVHHDTAATLCWLTHK